MKWFNDLKVSAKVLLACSVFLIIILLLSANTYIILNNSDRQFDSFFRGNFISSIELNAIKEDLLQMRINMLLQLEATKKNDITQAEKMIESNKLLAEDYRKNLDSFLSKAASDEEKKLANKLLKMLPPYVLKLPMLSSSGISQQVKIL